MYKSTLEKKTKKYVQKLNQTNIHHIFNDLHAFIVHKTQPSSTKILVDDKNEKNI